MAQKAGGVRRFPISERLLSKALSRFAALLAALQDLTCSEASSGPFKACCGSGATAEEGLGLSDATVGFSLWIHACAQP